MIQVSNAFEPPPYCKIQFRQLHGQSHRSLRRADVAYVVFVVVEGVNVSVEDEEDVVLLLLPQLLMVVVILQLQP